MVLDIGRESRIHEALKNVLSFKYIADVREFQRPNEHAAVYYSYDSQDIKTILLINFKNI